MIIRLFAFTGLIILSPLVFLASLLIYFEDGSPAIFKQKRLGKNMKEFTLYKIITMRNEAPSRGTHEVSKNYKLYFGSFLRKLKIDEFPQIFNVIIGDMNFFGSRPGLPNQIELKKFRESKGVFLSKPGITGLAQVCGYDMSDPYKLSKIDNLYNKRKNLFMYIKILLATISFLCRKDLKKFIVENTDV